jgi:hypothetical protein
MFWVRNTRHGLYRLVASLLALCALAVLAWEISSKPVLLHTHVFTEADYRSCGAYNEEGTGTTILNPLRSLRPERAAERFLQAVSHSRCSAEMSEGVCKLVNTHPLPAGRWRVAYIRKSGRDVDLFYRLVGASPECVMARVRVRQIGTRREISSYGLSY